MNVENSLLCCIGFSLEPTNNQLLELGKLLGKRWKDVARKMSPREMKESEIDEISYRHRDSIEEQATAMLHAWRGEHGAEATVKCLYDVLVDAKCTLAAEKVFGILKVTGTESPRGSGLDMGTCCRESGELIVAYAWLLGIVDDKQLYALAQDVGVDWSDLARSLDIRQVQIDNIKCDYESTDEKAHKMLSDWYWDKGSRADFNMVKRTLMIIRSRRKDQETRTERSPPRGINEGTYVSEGKPSKHTMTQNGPMHLEP